MTRVCLVVVALLVLVFVAPARADEATGWNQMMFRANVIAGGSPQVMSRTAAIVSAAMFDAVNAFERRYTPFHVTSAPPAGASRNAAAVGAAYRALVVLFPNQKGLFDTKLAVSKATLAARESTGSITSGIAWGETVANAILALRDTDGFSTTPPAFFGTASTGVWRSTPPGFLPFAARQFTNMTPWVIDFPESFRPGLPPALTSAQYTADFNEVKKFGRSDSAFRTPDQTVYSYFWNTSTAPALWNAVAVSLLEQTDDDDRWDDNHWGDGQWNDRHSRRRPSLLENTRSLALLNLAIADAVIGCWDAKWTYQYWRPVTAIAEAGDATWTPLFPTPAHSEYPSGHSCVSAAAGFVLANQFGEKTRFDMTSDAMPGVVRSFKSFSSALEEVKNARIYSGIHFRTATNVGQSLGRSVGEFVLENALRRVD